MTAGRTQRRMIVKAFHPAGDAGRVMTLENRPPGVAKLKIKR